MNTQNSTTKLFAFSTLRSPQGFPGFPPPMQASQVFGVGKEEFVWGSFSWLRVNIVLGG